MLGPIRQKASKRRQEALGWWSVVLLLALGIVQCTPTRKGWRPILEEISTGPLRAEIAKTAEQIGKAREHLKIEADADADADAAKADAELERAEESLRTVLVYYLPLIEARERAYNAYRAFYLDDKDRTASELDEIEKILVEMAGSGENLAHKLERPQGMVAAARSGVAGASEDAPARLEKIATELNNLVVKGELVLGPDEQ